MVWMNPGLTQFTCTPVLACALASPSSVAKPVKYEPPPDRSACEERLADSTAVSTRIRLSRSS